MITLFEQDPELRRVALRTPAGLLALGFGSGLAGFAPGTAGTVMAIPFALLLKNLPLGAYLLTLLALFALGVFV